MTETNTDKHTDAQAQNDIAEHEFAPPNAPSDSDIQAMDLDTARQLWGLWTKHIEEYHGPDDETHDAYMQSASLVNSRLIERAFADTLAAQQFQSEQEEAHRTMLEAQQGRVREIGDFTHDALVKLDRIHRIDLDGEIDRLLDRFHEDTDWRRILFTARARLEDAEKAARLEQQAKPEPDAKQDRGKDGARVFTGKAAGVSIMARVASEGDEKQPAFIVDDLIEAGTIGQFVGETGSYKSFLALDLCCCISTGTPFHGRKVKQGGVLYVAGEGGAGIARRLRAWAHVNKVTDEILVTDSPVDLCSADHAEALEALARDYMGRTGVPIRLVVFDTLARNMSGDENESKTINTVINSMSRLTKLDEDTTCIVVHHTGHGDKTRARGSSAQQANYDFSFIVSKTGLGQCKVENNKTKDAEPPADLYFDVVETEYGVWPDGKPKKSLVLKQADAAGQRDEVYSSPAYDAFEKALEHDDCWSGDAFTGLPAAIWRNTYLEGKTGNAKTLQKHVSDTAKQMIERGLIANDGTKRDALYMAESESIHALINTALQVRREATGDTPG